MTNTDKKYPKWAGDIIFTNKEGYDWFIDKLSSSYAESRGLKGYKFYLVGIDGEIKERIIVDKSNQAIFSSRAAEEIGVHIDILSLKHLWKTQKI